MEKVLAFQLNQNQLDSVYKVCSQMKIVVIAVQQNQMLMPLKQLLEEKAYKGRANIQGSGTGHQSIGSTWIEPDLISKTMDGSRQLQSMIVMCDLSEKHVDRLLAALRMGNVGIDYKAVMTPVNSQWNGMRMLDQMEAEKRSIEGR